VGLYLLNSDLQLRILNQEFETCIRQTRIKQSENQQPAIFLSIVKILTDSIR